MTDILSDLIWLQTVRKGYQRTTKVGASKESIEMPDYRGNIVRT